MSFRFDWSKLDDTAAEAVRVLLNEKIRRLIESKKNALVDSSSGAGAAGLERGAPPAGGAHDTHSTAAANGGGPANPSGGAARAKPFPIESLAVTSIQWGNAPPFLELLNFENAHDVGGGDGGGQHGRGGAHHYPHGTVHPSSGGRTPADALKTPHVSPLIDPHSAAAPASGGSGLSRLPATNPPSPMPAGPPALLSSALPAGGTAPVGTSAPVTGFASTSASNRNTASSSVRGSPHVSTLGGHPHSHIGQQGGAGTSAFAEHAATGAPRGASLSSSSTTNTTNTTTNPISGVPSTTTTTITAAAVGPGRGAPHSTANDHQVGGAGAPHRQYRSSGGAGSDNGSNIHTATTTTAASGAVVTGDHTYGSGGAGAGAANTYPDNHNGNNNNDTDDAGAHDSLARFLGPGGLYVRLHLTYGGSLSLSVATTVRHDICFGALRLPVRLPVAVHLSHLDLDCYLCFNLRDSACRFWMEPGRLSHSPVNRMHLTVAFGGRGGGGDDGGGGGGGFGRDHGGGGGADGGGFGLDLYGLNSLGGLGTVLGDGLGDDTSTTDYYSASYSDTLTPSNNINNNSTHRYRHNSNNNDSGLGPGLGGGGGSDDDDEAVYIDEEEIGAFVLREIKVALREWLMAPNGITIPIHC